MGETKHDSDFLDIYTDCGRPEIFLDKVFGFLYRRTEYYKLFNPSDGTGMPKGYANKIAFSAFCRYEKLVQDAAAKTSEKEKVYEPLVPESVPEVVSEEVYSLDGEKVSIKKHGDDPIIVDVTGEQAGPEITPFSEMKDTAEGGPSGTQMSIVPPGTSGDSLNGAACNGYSWSQAHKEVDIRVSITSNHKKTKVNLKEGNLNVTAILNGEVVTLLSGKLSKPTKESEMVWVASPGEYISISLEKHAQKWWDRLFEDDEKKIDLSKLNITQDLNSEEQQMVERLQHEAWRKQNDRNDKLKQTIDGQGNRTYEDALKMAWDAEGSPFKGTPYNPDAFQLN